MKLCRRQYCHRPAWKPRKLCKHHTLQSRRLMRARRARTGAARRKLAKRLGIKVTLGRPRGSAMQRAVTLQVRKLLPRWP
jgi:hypothetical protein